MRVRFRPALLAVTFAAVAGGCGSDLSTGPVNTQPATLDQALAELSTPAVAAAGGSLFDSGVDVPALLPAQCPYDATSQSFVCTPVTANGITIGQSFTLLTASNVKQAAFDGTTTAAVRANTTVGGTFTEGGTSLAIDGQQQLTLSGLISGVHTLNGASTMHLSGTVADSTGSIPLDLTLKTSVTNLVLPANTTPGTQIWPASGTVSAELSGTMAGLSIGTTKVTTIFSGTSTVDFTITGPGGSKSCKVDLSKTTAPSCP